MQELLRRSDFAGCPEGNLRNSKSINPERIRSNSDIFDFNIEEEDMAIIDTLNENLHVSHVPEDLRDIQF